MSIQECQSSIEKLSTFTGSELESTQMADAILQQITAIEHSARLGWLKRNHSDTLHYEHQSDQIELLHTKFRAAQLQNRENRRARWFEARKDWSKLPPAAQHNSTTKEGESRTSLDLDPNVGVSEQVSASLRRIHQLAQAEVLRSEMNIEELQSSSNALVDVQHKYSGVDMLLNGSKRLVKLLDQADTRDRRQMQLALSFLGAVMIWIIYRRVLKLPIKLLIWTLARILGIARFFVPKAEAPEAPEASASAATAAATSTLGLLLATAASTVEPLAAITDIETLESVASLSSLLATEQSHLEL